MSGQITGVARIKIDGDLLESLPGATLRLGGFENTEKSGHSVYGFSQKVVPAELECTIVHKNGTPLEDLRNLTAGLITFETDTGKVWMIANAVIRRPPEITDGEGEIKLEFFGDAAKEIV